MKKAILNAGKVDERRERLGRMLWESWPKGVGGWETQLSAVQDSYIKGAQCVLAEQRKIEEES